MNFNLETNIYLSKVNDLKNDWIISNSQITNLLKDNLQTIKTFTKLSDAILFVDKQDKKNINIVAHGYPGFIELGSGYSTESLEKELNDISEYTDFDQTTFNLWSCYGGSDNGIAQSLEKSLRTKVNSLNKKLGKGQSLELDENNKFQNEIANLPIYLHTNSVGFDVIDNGNGTFGLIVYYGTWHSGSSSKTTEGALSLYTLATGGDSTDSNDYTVEAYGQGGVISNQTYYFTNPPKNTGDITFTTTDFNTTSTSFIESQNGVGTTDLTDRGFTPGTNIFFGKTSDSSTLYAYNSTNGTNTASGFSGIYGYQSAYISTLSPGTYRAYYDGKGSWDSTDPLNAPAITMVFEPIDSIETALITISGSGGLTVGDPPKILNNSVDGDNGSSTTDFVTSGRDVVLNGTFDSSLASTKDTLTVDITTGSSTTTYTNASSELTTTSSGTWNLNLTSELSPATYSIVSTIKDSSNNSYTNTQSLTIVSGSLQSITTDDGISSTDLITTDKTLKLSGIYSSANATDIKITVKDGSNNILVNSQSPTSTTGDNWVYDLTGTTLSLGTYTVTVTVSESTGDSSSSSTFQIIDGPDAPVTTTISEDTGTSGDFTTTDTTLTISGTFDAADDASNSDSDGKLQVTIAGVTYTDTGSNDLTVDYSAGTWSLTPSSAFAVGSYSVLAEVTDSNGNYNSSSQNILVADAADTTAPTAPAISSIVDDNGTNTNFSTTDTSIAIKGTFDASDYAGGFTVNFGGNTYTLNTDTQLVANGNNWTLTYPLDASTGSVVATATDAGGNESTATQSITIVSTNLDSFNAFDYMAGYSDLLSAFGTNTTSAIEHYINFGYAEGRVKDNFDEWSYIASHTDLIAAFGSYSEVASLGTQHYVNHGHSENRVKDNFDEMSYLASHTDLISVFGGDTQAATRHYISFGYSENRLTNSFNAESYLNNYADLKSAFGNDLNSAKKHFVEHGFNEGRAL